MKIVIEGNTIDGSARSTLNVVLSGARGPQGPAGEAGASEWGDIGGTLSEQTDLQSALDAKVPYTGATQDVNLGEFGIQTGNIEFDTTPTNAPTGAGSMYYDDTSGTVVNILKGGNVISKIGETQHVRVYNNTGSPIAKGKVVAINGAQGQRPTIILADADSETLSKDTIGFTAESIADGAEGFVMIAGVLTNISTSGMADGDTLYLSTTAGSYTNVKPEAPVHMVILGFVVNGGSGGAGQIYVKVDNGYELEELHNVKETAKTTAVDADALLLKDSADSNLWKPFSWLNAKVVLKTYFDTLYNGILTFDSTPTNGSNNPVTSDGVFDALALKQDDAITATATLTTGSWSLVSGFYEQSISNANITASSIVDVIPDNSAFDTVVAAQVLPRTDSSSGAVKVYAKNLPTANIGVTLNIWK